MARNVLRDELVEAMRARVTHAWRHDPLALWVGLIKLINAVSFAVLMLKPVGWKLGLWFVFCVASLSVAAVLENARMVRKSTSADAENEMPMGSRGERRHVLHRSPGRILG